jgi:hypothetical protein
MDLFFVPTYMQICSYLRVYAVPLLKRVITVEELILEV